ncbi:putative leader peptide [Streptomyces sp. NPDC048650]|uniref:putative leader peptide n=1 Tax=unclassified Streptomyces TaxID=2593676 RepID=UPI0037119836
MSSPHWARPSVIDLPDAGRHLTVRAEHRHSDVMRPGPLLYGRAHVDLLRTASACCPSV